MNSISCGNKKYIPSKVVCIGKNYPAHIKEMGGGERPKEPVIFIKPNSSISFCPGEVFIPESLGLLHYEVELCFVVGKKLKDVSVQAAGSCIAAFSVGIDFTLRERQNSAKKRGEPWALAKGFDSSAVFGEFSNAKEAGDLHKLDISLKINSEIRQESNTSAMLYSPAEILSFASKFMTIEEGDVFMCGTPEGVGEIRSGEEVAARCGSLALAFKLLR